MSSHLAARPPGAPVAAAGVIHVDDPELDDLRYAVLARIRPAFADVEKLRCRLDRHGTNVVVRLTGPAISQMRRHAIAVRVLDAVGSIGRTFGHVDVTYEPTPGPNRPAP
jgi:hypothetical protein